jgi:two-component system chemotaxis response regulator CheB
MPGHDIIVIGTSAGGVEALRELVASLPSDLPVAIFIVIHISPHSKSFLPEILNRVQKQHNGGSLRAVHPQNGEVIQPGRIYIAPPAYHMLM